VNAVDLLAELKDFVHDHHEGRRVKAMTWAIVGACQAIWMQTQTGSAPRS
jgi:hypothetical protein